MMMYRKFVNLIGAACLIIFGVTIGNLFNYYTIDKLPDKITENYIVDTPGCKIPLLDPFHVSIRKFIKNISYSDYNCKSEQLFYMDAGNVLKVNKPVMEKLKERWKNVKCMYLPFRGTSDHNTDLILPTKLIVEDQFVVTDEFVIIDCFSTSPHRHLYRDFFASIVLKPKVEERCKKSVKKINTSVKLNVLLLGIDSVAKTEYLRHLLKVDKFFRSKTTLIELHGYNKVGTSTFPNMVAFHTGKHLEEFNTAYENVPINILPFLWKTFSNLGYRTLFAEDAQNIAIFSFFKKGFKHQPTDYYFRPFSLAVERSIITPEFTSTGCYINRTESSVLLKWSRDFIDKFRNDSTFSYVYLGRLTHEDYSAVGFYDDDLANYFEYLHSKGYTNNTMIFFFSDHGFNSDKIFKTYVGDIEKNHPFCFLLLPPWFPRVYPKFYSNLKTNERRLVTPFDIHATLKDISNFLVDVKPSVDSRSVSLFTPISASRTCLTAGIDISFCSCEGKQQLPVDSDSTKLAAFKLVKYINHQTSKYEDLCARLLLRHVIRASSEREKINAGEENESFVINYEMKIRVDPSGGIYQGTVTYVGKLGYFDVDNISIDRLDSFKKQSRCIDEIRLKPFCSCFK